MNSLTPTLVTHKLDSKLYRGGGHHGPRGIMEQS